MGNWVLKIFTKYRTCVFLNLIMMFGMLLSNVFQNLYVVENSLLSYNLYSIYIFKIIPIYCFIYGSLSYIVYKKIWIPQLILAVSSVLGFGIAEWISVKSNAFIVGTLVVTPCYAICSAMSALMTLIVYKAINSKNNR